MQTIKIKHWKSWGGFLKNKVHFILTESEWHYWKCIQPTLFSYSAHLSVLLSYLSARYWKFYILTNTVVVCIQSIMTNTFSTCDFIIIIQLTLFTIVRAYWNHNNMHQNFIWFVSITFIHIYVLFWAIHYAIKTYLNCNV